MKISEIILDESKMFIPEDQARLDEAVRLDKELGDAFWSEPMTLEEIIAFNNSICESN